MHLQLMWWVSGACQAAWHSRPAASCGTAAPHEAPCNPPCWMARCQLLSAEPPAPRAHPSLCRVGTAPDCDGSCHDGWDTVLQVMDAQTPFFGSRCNSE